MMAGDDERERVDVVIVGAGAAGLMTAASIDAGPGARVLLLDGAKTLGAKILVAGGGRCNVTHHAVDDRAYAGSTRPAIRKVLRRFGVEETIAFFAERGVTLKREETGKLFPTTDNARTVLDALLRAVAEAGAEVRYPRRVERVEAVATSVAEGSVSSFRVTGPWGTVESRFLVLATGGMALPKSGSDGAGYGFARAFGHSIHEPVFPALVPLLLGEGHPLRSLSGLTFEAELRLVAPTGKVLERFTNSTLCTHFGLSGPSVLDISRYWTAERRVEVGTRLELSVLPGLRREQCDDELASAGSATLLSLYRGRIPERLIRVVAEVAGVDPTTSLRQVPKVTRQRLAQLLTGWPLEPTGDRGFTHAEVTAGGVPLSELRLETMESRLCPGLHIIGELCDVDGRIGGFNFQWAWASGFVAGRAIAERLRMYLATSDR
jgi:predicted Rossmann fold flavoprotein